MACRLPIAPSFCWEAYLLSNCSTVSDGLRRARRDVLGRPRLRIQHLDDRPRE